MCECYKSAFHKHLFHEILIHVFFCRHRVSEQDDPTTSKLASSEVDEIDFMITDNLIIRNISDAEKAIQKQISEHELCDRDAQILIWLAKYSADRGNYEKAVDLMTQAMNLRILIFDEHHDNVIKLRNYLALIHWRNENIVDAALSAYLGLCSYEKRLKNIDNRDVAKQLLRVGYLFVRMQRPNEGIKAMEISMRTFEQLLPLEENDWLISATTLIRTCNDIGAHINALTLCCEVIDYFYESRFGNISEVNIPIYEIAAWHQVCASTSSDPPPMPTPINLPEIMVGIIRELTIIFIQFYFFTGTKVIDSWLDDCKIILPKVSHRLNRIEEIHRFNFTNVKKEEAVLRQVHIKHGKRGGWIEKAIETIEQRNFQLINTCDVLENWSEANFQKIRKKIHSKLHSRAADILKKAKQSN